MELEDTKLTERAEHLAWCKRRATEYVEAGDPTQALASMISDMSKRDDTAIDPMLAMLGMMEANNGSAAVQRWIDGFN